MKTQVVVSAQEALPAAIDGSSDSISDSDETTYVDSDDECTAMVVAVATEDESGPEYAAFWDSTDDEGTPSPPLKRAKKAALPGLSADSTTIPDHLEFRGRLVDGHGQLIMRSWMLGPIIQQQHNHQPTKLLIQYEHPCKQKSRCCECLAQFTKK